MPPKAKPDVAKAEEPKVETAENPPPADADVTNGATEAGDSASAADNMTTIEVVHPADAPPADADTPPPPPPAPDAPTSADVLVAVGRPCVKCWPKGWPAKEDGASVNCPHNLLVIYGKPNRVPRSLALECGLAEGTDFHPIPAKVSE